MTMIESPSKDLRDINYLTGSGKCASSLSPSFYHSRRPAQLCKVPSRPTIDEVFWTYETLFNKIDMLKATFSLKKYRNRVWVDTLHVAVDVMASQFRKHYTLTAKPFVYPNSVIL